MSSHMLRHGGARTTTVKCPKCGDIIVYNGNFFCNGFDAIDYDEEARDVVIREGSCDWALPHPATSAQDAKIAAQLITEGRLKDRG